MIDDLAVGKGGGGFGSEFPSEQPPSQPTTSPDDDKPLEDRLVSKIWNVRAKAFEEYKAILGKFEENSANEQIDKHSSLWKTYLSDANAGALEKALDCFEEYIKKASPNILKTIQGPILSPLIEKCLGQPRQNLRAKSLECVFLLFEVTENFDEDIQEILIKYTQDKRPKIFQTSITLLSELLKGFGVKKIKLANYTKQIDAAANSSQPAVRAEAMNCYKAIYLWIGEAGVDPFIEGLKQAQKDQLKKDFEALKAEKTPFKRQTRSEKAAAKEAEIDAAINAEESKEEEVIDVYDLSAPKEILSTLTPDWVAESVALKKWDEKRDKLIQVQELAKAPKLASGNYSVLFDGLKKMAGENHAVVAQNAIKAIGLLANGLRAEFHDMAIQAVPVLFSKYKEKRIVDDINEAMQQILKSVQLNEILEVFKDAIKKEKAPAGKVSMMVFLEQAIRNTYIDPLTDMKDILADIPMSLVDEKDAALRDQALVVVGVMVARLGDPAMAKYTDGMIKAKLDKITAAKETVKLSKYDKSERKAAAEKKKKEAAEKKAASVKPSVSKVGASAAAGSRANEDAEMLMMNDEQTKPLKAPPKLGQKKTAPKKESVETEKEPSKPVGGPPARLAAGSSAAAAPKSTGPAKIISVKDIKEEDIGSGMSKDEAISKVKEFYSASHVSKMEETKWQDRVEGFQGIQAQIAELKPDARTIEATCKYIKANMKDWKESNLNLMKESIATFRACVDNCDNVPKRAVVVYAPFLGEKIGDIKMSASIKELYMQLGEFVTAKFVSIQVIKQGLQTKAPNNIKEAANFLSDMIDDYGIGRVAVKETVDFAVFCANHANKAVRDASMALFAMIYKHLGEAVRQFLSDIKPSTQQLIDAEFQKVTPYQRGEFKSNRAVKGEAQEMMATGGAAAAAEEDPLKALDDALPREDISKQLNAAHMKLFKEGDWKNKVKGCELTQGILAAAKMRIMPDGIGELMDAITKCFKESNKAVLKQAILLLGAMAEATGEPILKYGKKCLVPCLNFLGDKAALMRADVITVADKWGDAVGAQHVINYICTYLEAGNPEMRENGLKWIQNHKDAIKKAEQTAMVKPVIACLTDKKSEIRTTANDIIVTLISQIGFAPFQNGIKDLKPAIQQTVRPLLEKAKQQAVALNPNSVEMEVDSVPNQAQKKIEAKPAPKGPTLKIHAQAAAAAAEKESSEVKPPAGNSFAAASERKTLKVNSAGVGSKPTLKAAVQQEEDEFTCNPGNKERRALADSKSKWMHEELNKNQVEALKKNSEEIFGFEFQKNMFGQDFKKHVQCIQKFIGMIQETPQNLQEVVDIIFKWICVKMIESSNTTFALNVYDFYSTLFSFLIQQQYILWDHEAQVVVPMLCNQSGVNNKTLQAKIKSLIKQCFELHDHKKTMMLVTKYGCSNKNLKSVAESLDEVAIFLAKNGLDAINEPQVKLIAKLCDSGDAGVREKALQVLSEIYKVLDEDVWSIIGTVPIKVKGLLEQRFKKLKGLGSSKSNMNMTMQARPATAVNHGSTPSKQSKLNSSFNPKNQTTTPRTGLKFQGLGKSNLENSLNKGSGLQRSFRPGTASQSKLSSSIRSGERSIGGGLKTPSTVNKQQSEVNRGTTKVLSSGRMLDNQFMQAQRMTEIPNFHPDPDVDHLSDEDLTADQPGSASKPEEVLDPETKKQVDDIVKHINNLKYSSELSKRVESLIALNDIIQQVDRYEAGIQRTANDLISSFTHELKDIFDRPKEEMPLRFAKYFVTIVNKTCSCKKIMEIVREQELYELGEQLLKRLLIENLDKLGEDKEGEFILKNLNGSMLRCLENCNKTSIFCVLFNLLRRYKETPEYAKLPGLIIKCLLKLSKILEKVINELEYERVLIVIHLYMISIDHEKKSSNDDMGIRIVKTLVHEMVKTKQHEILKAYKIVERHEVEDKHLIRWIKIILNSIEPQQVQSQPPSTQSYQDPETEINGIFGEIREDESTNGLAKLHSFLNRNPHLNLDYYLRNLDQQSQVNIKEGLERYKRSLSDSGSTPQEIQINAFAQANENDQPQNRPSFQTANTNQAPRFGLKSSLGTTSSTNLQQNATSGGSSFRATQTTGLKFPNTSRPTTAVTSGGGTGGLKTHESSFSSNQQAEQTSSDRINTYANKLSQMRDKFQQRKSLIPSDPKGVAPGQTSQPNSATAQKKNLNTSFSAMNSSLQAKWAVVSKIQGSAAKDGTAIGGGIEANRQTMANPQTNSDLVDTQDNNLTQSQNAALAARLGQNGGAASSATNTELNRKLQEMKAKLAALKKL